MGYGVAAYRGDPGFGSFIRGAISKVSGVLRHIPGPQGALLGAVHSVASGGGGQAPSQPRGAPPMPTVAFPGGGRAMGGMAGSAAAGHTVVQTAKGPQVKKLTKSGKPYKSPRMNVGNARALRRAIRRQEGFVKLARRALKGTKYRITTGSGRSRPRTVVHESGPGSVTVR